MDDIARQIGRLGSAKASERYDACEELRVMPAITDEARERLLALLDDAKADVADAA